MVQVLKQLGTTGVPAGSKGAWCCFITTGTKLQTCWCEAGCCHCGNKDDCLQTARFHGDQKCNIRFLEDSGMLDGVKSHFLASSVV